MENTLIGWCHHTMNPWWGCARVSRACRFCYAEELAHRWGHNIWGRHSPRKMMSDANWRKPLKWNREAARDGWRPRVFCASMADVFEDHPDVVDARRRLWDLIDATPNLDWLLLTKRPENVMDMIPGEWIERQPDGWDGPVIDDPWPENVWIGCTVEDQAAADERIPHLQQIPAKIRFLSMEPLVEHVDLSAFLTTYTPSDGNPQVPRGSDLPSGREGVLDDRPRRQDLVAPLRAAEQVDTRRARGETSQTAASREAVGKGRGVLAGPGDDRWDEVSRLSPPAGLAPSSRPDPSRSHDQPRERYEVGQQVGEPDSGDQLGTAASRATHTRRGSVDGAVGDGQPVGRADVRSGANDPGTPNGGRTAEVNRNRLRGDSADHLPDSKGRSSISWIICGGESGAHATPTMTDWFRSIRDQCVSAGVPFFFKQHGTWHPAPWKLDRLPGESDNDYKSRSNAEGATHSRAPWEGSFQKLDHQPWSTERSPYDPRPHQGFRRGPKDYDVLDGVTWKQFPVPVTVPETKVSL